MEGSSASEQGIRQDDIIRSFQLGTKKPIDIEDTTMNHSEWMKKIKTLGKQSNVKRPLKVTFLRGLKFGPVFDFSNRRRLSALSERFRRVCEFQASTEM